MTKLDAMPNSTDHNQISPPRQTLEKLAYTVAEACSVTGIGKTSLYELIKEGQLKSIKAVGRRLILKSDLEAFLNSCRDATA